MRLIPVRGTKLQKRPLNLIPPPQPPPKRDHEAHALSGAAATSYLCANRRGPLHLAPWAKFDGGGGGGERLKVESFGLVGSNVMLRRSLDVGL